MSFTLDEDMEELDRASFLLTKGHVRQKLSVCLSFASLVREFGEDATSGLTDALLEFSQSRDAGQVGGLPLNISLFSSFVVFLFLFFLQMLLGHNHRPHGCG